MTSITRILLPIDFSPTSRLALEWTMGLARTHRASVTLLHVQDLPDLTPLSPSMEALLPSYNFLNEVVSARHEEAKALLGEWIKPYEGDGVPIDSKFCQGVPFDVILDVCQQGGHDLIVMGTHGRTGVGRFLLGSTTERVVRLSPVPVLTVRLPTTDA